MPQRKPAATNKRARWGLLLQVFGYAVGSIWMRRPPSEYLAISVACGAAGVVLAWMAVRHLGLQWRIDAGLYHDHNLVRGGPYRVVRHPVYASMILMLLANSFLLTTWPFLLAGLALMIAGTEIRVRTEDALLASRFGEEFMEYRRSVPAYIPFLR